MAVSERRAVALEPRVLHGLPDADLLALVSSGDLDAFAVLYDRHVEATWRVALHYSDEATDAERAVAAAFLQVWREPGRDRGRLAARLRSEATHTACELRRRSREREAARSGQPHAVVAAKASAPTVREAAGGIELEGRRGCD